MLNASNTDAPPSFPPVLKAIRHHGCAEIYEQQHKAKIFTHCTGQLMMLLHHRQWLKLRLDCYEVAVTPVAMTPVHFLHPSCRNDTPQ